MGRGFSRAPTLQPNFRFASCAVGLPQNSSLRGRRGWNMWRLAGDKEKRAQELLSSQKVCGSPWLWQPKELWVSKSWRLGPVCIVGFL